MNPQTFTYKSYGSVPVKLDLYLPESQSHAPAPVLLWFHGGGLLQGSRANVAPHMLHGVNKYGYSLISADYRLAPQVSVAEILTDVQDCLKFIRNNITAHVSPALLDTSRIAVSGSSAGGYLALLAGLYAEAKPKVILAIYPITNPLGRFFTNPQPHPDGYIDRSVIAPFLDRNVEAMTATDGTSKRQKMYHYMMQEAILADLLDVKTGDDKFIIKNAIRKAGKFVPCFIVHGNADRFVGVEQADEVVEALKDIGADCEYERLSGLDHLFDRDDKVQMENLYAFMAKYI
jgi:acetyl esterase/lipase